ncbi:MAG: hypothetical protein M1G31_00170 [Pseudanabaena sp. Salubria-1]|nr:hypothetical protein [Pseudanabaena sp. Salubria-1]
MMFTYFECCQQSSKILFFINYNATSIPNSLPPPESGDRTNNLSHKGDRYYYES